MNNTTSCIPVSPGTIKALLMGRDMGIDKIHRLVFSKQSLAESRQILSRFIAQVLGREVKSLGVLDEIRRLTL